MNFGRSARRTAWKPVLAGRSLRSREPRQDRKSPWRLLSFTGKLVVIGFGMAKNEYSISRLMAFDAEIIGTWGCLPEYYPIVLDMVLSKKIDIAPFVETRPMSQIQSVFNEVHKAGSPEKRIVLTPDF